MNSSLHPIRLPVILATAAIATASMFLGCVGVRTEGEKRAQQHQQAVGRIYRAGGDRPVLPRLDRHSPLHDYLLFAMLNQPRVEAAYFDWAASVKRISVERSLPDPRLTFQSDITDMVMSLMPGLMMDFPDPGKLKWAASVATAESERRYAEFESTVLQIAFALKKAYYELYFLDAKIDVNRESLRLVQDIEQIARGQNDVGKVSLQDVLRAQIEQERLETEIDNLDDSRNPLISQFTAALGLKADDAAPPMPQSFESTSLDLASDDLFDVASMWNPRLKAMEAEVRRADASIRLAYRARVPDSSAGIMVDVEPSPVMVRPLLAVTLPIWRDKIAAQIAGAQSERRAAEARLSAEQIELAVAFAEKSFLFREASRNFDLLTERLLPMARQSVDVARSGYVSGKLDFVNLLDAQQTLLGFRLSEVDARVQRELALAELSLLILAVPPPGAPLLAPESMPGVDLSP